MKQGGRRKWNICKDALTLFTNTSKNSSLIHRTQKYRSGIEQRWPRESLFSLPMIDGGRVSEISFDFLKRTSCAADHVVIEMLRELDSDIWETIASCFQFRLLNHWTEDTDSVWKTQLVTMVKKKNGKLTMLPTIYMLCSTTLQQLPGGALQSTHGPQYGHPWSASP